MTDTQWPRFEVFQQDRADRPHRNIGTVHAPDAEMAMMNARDVFVRRPATVSLWIVPAEAIFSRTAEELEADPDWFDSVTNDGQTPETFCVFQKQTQRRSMTFVEYSGQVEAGSLVAALAKAIRQYGDRTQDTYVWWICPAGAILRSEDEDIASMFAPALDKHYRMPREYHVLTQMMEIKREGEL